MFDQFWEEHSPQLPYRELTEQENIHLQKQMYYFIPFIRQTYEALRLHENNTFNVAILEDIKNLAIYYGSALVYGDFDLKKEQKLIDNIFKNSGLPKEELKQIVLSCTILNGDDGNLKKYFFGDLSTEEIFTKELPGGPFYDMGLGDGIAVFDQKSRFDLVQSFVEHAKGNLELPSISILGNVARGVIDAATLFVGLQKSNILSQLHLYRVSSQTMGDKEPIVLNEYFKKDSWAVAVDSFTAGGRSVPLSLKLMNDVGFMKRSIFLTHCGDMYANKDLTVQFQWEHPFHGKNNTAGTLLSGEFKNI